LERADNIILNVRKHGVPSPIITPEDRQNKLLQRYLDLDNHKEVAVRTCIESLDYVLGGGLFNGDVIVLGARPGMGKTTFMQTIANNISTTKNILFCSAEMTTDNLSDRDVAGIIGVPTNVVRLGNYQNNVFDNIVNIAIPNLRLRQIYYYEDTPLTVDRILQACISMKMRHGLDAVMIDYLGMLDDEYGHSQYERVGYISRKIKQLAKKLNLPVLIAHQLNRGVQEREEKRPQLSDLRDSGKVEEDADIVMFLYRDTYYNVTDEGQPVPPTELIIAKHRQGEANKTIYLDYDKVHQLYTGR
jgi:replicative DNA helicase